MPPFDEIFLAPKTISTLFLFRFNCRDAVWWWMNCIKSYAEEVPEGHEILKESVSRIFPEDESEACPLGQVVQPLEDVIQEVLQKHFKGLRFRERNAGKSKRYHIAY